MDRQAITDALTAKLSGALAGQVVTFGPRLKHWSDVEPSAQPAAFLNKYAETAVNGPSVPSTWHLRFHLWVYAYDTSAAGPSTVLSDITDTVQAALVGTPADPGTSTSLGGLVTHVWVASTESDDEWNLMDQGVVRIDIELLTQG